MAGPGSGGYYTDLSAAAWSPGRCRAATLPDVRRLLRFSVSPGFAGGRGPARFYVVIIIKDTVSGSVEVLELPASYRPDHEPDYDRHQHQ